MLSIRALGRRTKFKGTVDSCLFLTVIRNANVCSLFQNVHGDIIISYIEVNAIFCTRIDFTKNICNVIKFRGRQKQRKHVQGNDIQGALSPSTAIF